MNAIDLLEKVIADQEKLPMQNVFALAYRDLSYLHEQLGEYDLAIQVRTRGAKLFPNDPYFHQEKVMVSKQIN